MYDQQEDIGVMASGLDIAKAVPPRQRKKPAVQNMSLATAPLHHCTTAPGPRLHNAADKQIDGRRRCGVTGPNLWTTPLHRGSKLRPQTPASEDARSPGAAADKLLRCNRVTFAAIPRTSSFLHHARVYQVTTVLYFFPLHASEETVGGARG